MLIHHSFRYIATEKAKFLKTYFTENSGTDSEVGVKGQCFINWTNSIKIVV